MRVLALALALAIVAVLVPMASAQPVPAPILTLEGPTAPLKVPAGGSLEATVRWTVEYGGVAGSAASVATNLTIKWTLRCAPGVGVLVPAPTYVTIPPGATSISDDVALGLTDDHALAGMLHSCTLTGVATPKQPGTLPASEPAELELQAILGYSGIIEAKAPVTQREAGPQKQMAYAIEVTNKGNGRTQVVFELVDPPGGGWHLLLPTPVIVDPDETVEAVLIAATPDDNGYNSGSTTFTVRAVPVFALDPGQAGEPVDVLLGGKVQGVYAPGPAMPLLGLALLVAALAVRRR